MKQILKERDDIAFNLILYAPAHPQAKPAMQYALCGKDNAEKLTRFETTFDKKPTPKAECINEVLIKNSLFAKAHDIKGTPHVVLPDGSRLRGFVEKEVLLKLIDLSVKYVK